jgi:hypothetical protein
MFERDVTGTLSVDTPDAMVDNCPGGPPPSITRTWPILIFGRVLPAQRRYVGIRVSYGQYQAACSETDQPAAFETKPSQPAIAISATL